MILVVFALLIFAFLLLGSIVFLVCALIPSTRRYALSAALWCAVWGPCSVGLIAVAGFGIAAGALMMKASSSHWTDAPKLIAALGWSYIIIGALITICVATGAAWLHQMLIHRFTFLLFRIYAAAVSAGIGSVFGWALGWWIAARESQQHWVVSLFILFLLIAGFGTAAYKGARGLRGKAPTRFTWITPGEFAGSNDP
jgi:hypothetical protein